MECELLCFHIGLCGASYSHVCTWISCYMTCQPIDQHEGLARKRLDSLLLGLACVLPFGALGLRWCLSFCMTLLLFALLQLFQPQRLL